MRSRRLHDSRCHGVARGSLVARRCRRVCAGAARGGTDLASRRSASSRRPCTRPAWCARAMRPISRRPCQAGCSGSRNRARPWRPVSVVARLDVRELSLARAEQAARVKPREREPQEPRARAGHACGRRARRYRASTSTRRSRTAISRRRTSRWRGPARADRRAARALAHHGTVCGRRLRPRAARRRRGRARRCARAARGSRTSSRSGCSCRCGTCAQSLRSRRQRDLRPEAFHGGRQPRSCRPAMPRSQSFEVLVKAPPVDGLLAPGNTVEVELPLGAPQRKLAVHRDALIIRAEGLYVYRVNDERRAERVSSRRVSPTALARGRRRAQGGRPGDRARRGAAARQRARAGRRHLRGRPAVPGRRQVGQDSRMSVITRR